MHSGGRERGGRRRIYDGDGGNKSLKRRRGRERGERERERGGGREREGESERERKKEGGRELGKINGGRKGENNIFSQEPL